jgi:hypothetical protein
MGKVEKPDRRPRPRPARPSDWGELLKSIHLRRLTSSRLGQPANTSNLTNLQARPGPAEIKQAQWLDAAPLSRPP